VALISRAFLDTKKEQILNMGNLTAMGSHRQQMFTSHDRYETCPLTKCKNRWQEVADSEQSQEIHVSG